jgi:hypothetical protein
VSCSLKELNRHSLSATEPPINYSS